jgi:hypothetical protein
MRTRLLLSHAFAVLVCAVPVQAQLDTEPANSTIGGADGLGLAPMQARLNLAGLGGIGDVDFYSNFLLTGDIFVGMTTPLGSLPVDFNTPDTIMGVFDPDSTMIAFNDDAGTDAVGGAQLPIRRGSLLRYGAGQSGPHAFAVTGFDDFGFGGFHGEFGPYALTVARFPVSPTVGGDFADSPGNSGIAASDSLNLAPLAAVNAVANLTEGGDVDFYSVFMDAGDVLTAFTTPFAGLPGDFTLPDTLLGVFDSSGTQISVSDDAGTDAIVDGEVIARGSAIRYLAVNPGLYHIAVTGFGDDDFAGAHLEGGLYGLTASLIPEPSTAGLLALGLFGLVHRRRR